MHDAVALLAVFALATLGFAAAALAMERHWRDLVNKRHGPSRRLVARLRRGGALSMAAALAVAVQRDGAAFGILLWCLALTAGALAVAAAVTWTTARARRRTGAA